MHDLVHLEHIPSGALTIAEIDATIAFAAAEKAAATRAAYASDWRDFAAWCAVRGATPLPAHVGIVAAYLSSLAESGRKASTIGRRAAAIGHRHKLAGYEPPTSQEAVKAVMRGIRRTIGAGAERKNPATADIITTMLQLCPPTLAGARDRALLALGFAGAFRRSELVALQVADLEEVPDGYRVTIRRSKTDQTGEGVEIVIPRGLKIRPVAAVQAWLQTAGITEGICSVPFIEAATCAPGACAGPMWLRL
jgi:integrase